MVSNLQILSAISYRSSVRRLITAVSPVSAAYYPLYGAGTQMTLGTAASYYTTWAQRWHKACSEWHEKRGLCDQ